MDCIKSLKFDQNGLIPVIAQDHISNKVLMFAWMNAQALTMSIEKKQAVYYSRSRQKLWHKGEESGHTQHIKKISVDCDQDVVLLSVEQQGGIACHTGREHCFFYDLDNNNKWQTTANVIKNPEDIYSK